MKLENWDGWNLSCKATDTTDLRTSEVNWHCRRAPTATYTDARHAEHKVAKHRKAEGGRCNKGPVQLVEGDRPPSPAIGSRLVVDEVLASLSYQDTVLGEVGLSGNLGLVNLL